MSDSLHPLHSCIVRFRDAEGTIVGAGFLATPDLVCTCAHVVADALHLPRETAHLSEQEVHLDFPYFDGAQGTARPHVWIPLEPGEEGGDIAILRLGFDPPQASQPARLLPASRRSGNAFEAYGFPSETDVGQYAYGLLRDRLANGFVQLEGTNTQGYHVKQGYSGTPVWDQRGRGVVGMVVAADRTAQTQVAFLLPNDLIFRVCPQIKPVTLHQLFAPLTDGLIGLPRSPLSGVEQFLRTYLGTVETPAPFGGRREQLAELDRWLATPGQPYALLVEEAGRGKSALLAQWVAAVADEHRADVVFVPISIRFGTSLKSTAFSLLGARLRYLHRVRAEPCDAEGWLAEIEEYLREDRSAKHPLLIILDGADEATNWGVGEDLRFPPEPGNGVKVLVSARSMVHCDAQGWLRRLEWQGEARRVTLPRLDRWQVAEVLQAMGTPLAEGGTQIDMVSELHRLSEGDPLLVRLYVEALQQTGERAAFLTSEELRHLKPGLQAYFDQWWNDQHRQWGTAAPLREPAVRTLLNLLACALGPLSLDDLLALTNSEHFDSWTLTEAFQPLARFVVADSTGQSYVFSHPRLNQYFYEKLTPRERQSWGQRFLDYGHHTLAELIAGKCHPSDIPSYPVQYYGTHLERAGGHPHCFDELVSEGWQRAWEALEGTYDGFLSDLMRAWKGVEAVGAEAQSTQERGQAIGRQCRYALIMASIKSLAGNIPATLLAAVVRQGVWTPAQGLASARQISSEWGRAEALAGLAPHLSAPLLQEALEAARAIGDERGRAEALAELIPRLGELGDEKAAVEAACAIGDEGRRAQALAGLAPHLSAPLLQQALEAARAIGNEWDRAKALAGLAPHLSAPLQGQVLQQALEAARAIGDEWGRAKALAGLAPHLSAPLLQQALEAARAIGDEWGRAKALAGLAPHFSAPLLQQALEAARAIGDERWRAEALAGLAPHLSAPLQGQVLQQALEAARAIGDEWGRAKALAGLAPHLSAPLLQQALEAARAIGDERWRAEALAGLAPHFSAPLQGQVLQQALEAARAIDHEWGRAEALAGLAPHFSAPLQGQVLQQALEAARAIGDEWGRAKALAGLAPHLSAPLLQQALEAARAIGDERDRAQALTGLIPRLGELGNEKAALEAARAIGDEWWRVEALAGLVPHLSAPLQGQVLQEALEATRAIGNEWWQAEALAGLASHLSAPLLQEALEAARAIDHEWGQAGVLAGLIPRLGELGDKKTALEAARAIDYEWGRAEALAGLIPRLGELGDKKTALEAARAIDHEWGRAEALAGLASHLSAPLLQEALEAARAIGHEWGRAEALAGLASHLSAPLLQEALEAARAIGHEGRRAEVLAGLAPHLSAPLQGQVLQEALKAARTIGDGWGRAKALAGLASHLSAPLQGQVLQEEALEAARTIGDGWGRAKTLAGLASHLSAPLQGQVLQEALEAARAIGDERWRANVLAGLASHLSAPLLQEALEAARTIDDEGRRAEALAGLAPHLSAPLLQEALEAARAIGHKGERAEALVGLALQVKHLPVVELYALWSQTLHVLASRTRSDLLRDIRALMPLIETLGGKEALVVVTQTIIEVGKWFP